MDCAAGIRPPSWRMSNWLELWWQRSSYLPHRYNNTKLMIKRVHSSTDVDVSWTHTPHIFWSRTPAFLLDFRPLQKCPFVFFTWSHTPYNSSLLRCLHTDSRTMADALLGSSLWPYRFLITDGARCGSARYPKITLPNVQFLEGRLTSEAVSTYCLLLQSLWSAQTLSPSYN